MKNIILLILSIITLNSFGQIGTKIKYKQMENPATSSVNLGSQTFSAGTSYLTNSTTIGTGTVGVNTTSLGILRVKQGDSRLDIGEHSSGGLAMWGGVASTSNTISNYNLYLSTSTSILNGTTSARMAVGGNTQVFATSSGVRIGSAATANATLDVTGTMSVSGTSTLTGAAKQTNTLNYEGNTTWNTNQTNTLTTGNSGTVAVLSDALFSISFEPNNFGPSDGSTVYFGNTQIEPKSNANNGKIILPYNCTLVKWDYNAVCNGANGSAESVTISINGTTNYTLSSVITLTTAYTNYTTTAISQNFNAGDVINIKEVFPTFVTNPLDVYQGLTLWFVRRQ